MILTFLAYLWHKWDPLWVKLDSQDLRTLDPRQSRLPYGTYQYLDVTSHREWDMSKLLSGLHPQRRYSRMFYFGLYYAHDACTQRFL